MARAQVPHNGVRGGRGGGGGAWAPGRASIIHCRLFINNSPTTHTQTHVSFCPLCCWTPISPFLCSTDIFFHSGVLPFRPCAALARVPSPPHAKATACPTCHWRHNKGARCDTCPCYTPLCSFRGVSFSPRTKTPSDKLHAMGNTFWDIVETAAAIPGAETSTCHSKLYLYYKIIQYNEASGAIVPRLRVI